MRNHRRSYRHLRSLIAVLDTVFPAATQDPNFLHRSLLIEGVSLRATPCDLLDEALGLQVEGAVVVRDAEFGDSVGLLVLTHAHDTEVAMAAGPRPGVFCDCIKASDSSYTRFQILEALDDRVRRQATAELFRSLVPPEYLLADAAMTFHLSCVFLRGPDCSSEHAVYNLCNIGARVLLANGPVNAVILGPDHDVAVLVYYDAQGTERIGRREPHLRQRQLGMYDSSLFPLPAGAAAEEASLVRRLLPPFVTAADYLGRVILLTEINTTTCDAENIARFIILQAELRHGLEAVIVHRALGAVFVVLQRQSDSELLLQVPQEEWLAVFKSPVELQLLQATPMQQQQQQQLAPVQQFDLSRLSIGLRQWVNPKAFEIMRLGFRVALTECPDHNFMELTLGLMRLAALSQPHALRRSYFPDRAVLLTGTCIYMKEWDLRTALSRYGSLDELVYLRPRRIALIIFTSWTGATRLLREPAETRRRRGFGDCRPAAPDAGVASSIANTVLQDLLSLQSRLPAYW
ncbi:hypothetical protein SORBI_3002G382800 [Sorghum bicolor]|uniref:Uncharacterized protein n=4 Tax=Sorghum bicolor TaxID=4558 RepID=A0A1B6QFP3_SORBI|nr:hypothetical protein SORBI_3002G382800 [Sorghum bicolor]